MIGSYKDKKVQDTSRLIKAALKECDDKIEAANVFLKERPTVKHTPGDLGGKHGEANVKTDADLNTAREKINVAYKKLAEKLREIGNSI